MVRSTEVTLITNSTLLSLNFDIYLINAITGSLTITLPPILSDGMNYRLVRIDSSDNIVTIKASGLNQIISNVGNGTVGSSSSGSIILNKNNTLGTESYQNNWYLLNNTTNNRTIFSALLSQSPTVPFIGYLNTTRNSIGIFPYLGSSTELINTILITVAPNTTALTTGTIDLRNKNTSVVLASKSYSFTGTTSLSTISMTNLINVPITLSLLDLGITTNGKQLNVYSLVVK